MHPWFYRISSSLMLPRAFSVSPRDGLTILLYHRFMAPGESRESGVERLRRQLDWLSSRYTLISMSEGFRHLAQGTLPPYRVVITVDDADLDLLDVYPVFEHFGVPPTIGVVVGWTDRETADHDEPTVTRLIDYLHWYDGSAQRIDLGGGQSVVVSGQHPRDQVIDQLLEGTEREGSSLVASVWRQLSLDAPMGTPRANCNWSELLDLQRRGAEMASHSVSHCRLSRCSEARLRFELEESRRVLSDRMSSCSDFVYPFGTDDMVDARTTSAVARSGYRCALLTRAGLATADMSPFHLPRIEIPDHRVETLEYRDRVLGGQIPFDVARRVTGRLLRRLTRDELPGSA